MNIGQRVRIRQFRDSVGREVAKRVGEVGTIAELKILDGCRLGYVVTFSDRAQTWFFAEELEAVA